jgi:cyclase
MFVIPAIDIKDGKCVRLFQGDFSKVTTYGDNPAMVAKRFVERGARLLHIIDLDGAKAGEPMNSQLVLSIAGLAKIPLQVGGGIRSYETAKTYLEGGVRRIILSTAAIENPELVTRLVKEFGYDRIVVAVDIKNGRFATDGWTKSGGKSVAESIKLLKKLSIKNVLVTDVSKDGALKGPNFALVQQFIDAGFQAIGAGGVTSLPDVTELNKRGAYGAVVGKAAYEGTIDIAQAQVAASYKNNLAKRVIPCLDVKDGQVVKGTNFTKLRVVGDPVELAKKYSQTGADELVFLDIAATVEERKTFAALVSSIAKAIDIPFTVGGGITSLDDIRLLLRAGADKVSIGSAAVLKPDLVKQAATYFGSQCIVISVDAKRKGGGWVVYIKGGTEATAVDAFSFCEDMERSGAGELLINSLDRDGMNTGFDLELLRTITKKVNIPVIASSGGGSPQDFADVFRETGVDAALGASIFHYQDTKPSALKEYLADQKVQVRL